MILNYLYLSKWECLIHIIKIMLLLQEKNGFLCLYSCGSNVSDNRQKTNSEINRSIHFLIVSKNKLGTIFDTFYSSVQLVLLRSSTERSAQKSTYAFM
jgi:hypothetical protein